MTNIVDLDAIRNKLHEEKTSSKIETIDVFDEQEATYLSVLIAADLVEFIENMGCSLEDNPESMRDVYMVVDNIKALILRMHNISCATHDVNDMLVGHIDIDEHLKKFRTILDHS